MLRLPYADQDSKQDLLDAVRATRAWALAGMTDELSDYVSLKSVAGCWAGPDDPGPAQAARLGVSR